MREMKCSGGRRAPLAKPAMKAINPENEREIVLWGGDGESERQRRNENEIH